MIKFNNTYTKLPENFFQRVNPTKFKDPKLIIFNYELAKDLNINPDTYTEDDLSKIFSGQKILEGSEPIAQAYAGFQFGHPNPQLGDGRAHLLGEVNGFDIQLKGSGQTKFSRRGDGKSALGPVLREYILSEAMHALGVPTTRALCAVSTGEEVQRQFGNEPGGVFTRVASGHIRVGTFQYFLFKEDYKSMEVLLNYTINRHYKEYNNLSLKDKAIALLKTLIEKQSDLIAKWSSFGFIHGVMNTDNFSVVGITIDYGPCAFMDDFKFHKVFSSIDQHSRYSFFNQVPIAIWNILRLADCLLHFIDESQDKAIEIVEKEVISLMDQFSEKRMIYISKKLGIKGYKSTDEKLVMSFLNYLEKESLDFTLAFRNLPKLFNDNTNFYPETAKLLEFKNIWKSRVNSVDHLDCINPLYIPRNHQVEKAIDLAYKGDFTYFYRLHEVLKSPFKLQDEAFKFSQPPTKDQRVYQTFCGT